ncbi:hypothetical protein BDN71DRAFT_896753 [Pleurotus eryngii]|uniref:Thioesterase domain-containing protein n=1 Tax=Pleurotus eryngii TaxID=5323 RepID=A0A9P5ZWM0_PLEER|nr:hypothetical protein BDN71DRAFT_896753 [Pleurotus eryngii]
MRRTAGITASAATSISSYSHPSPSPSPSPKQSLTSKASPETSPSSAAATTRSITASSAPARDSVLVHPPIPIPPSVASTASPSPISSTPTSKAPVDSSPATHSANTMPCQQHPTTHPTPSLASSPSLAASKPKHTPKEKPWIDPASLPTHGSVAHIAGNAPEYIKHLTQNTFFAYGVGTPPSPHSHSQSQSTTQSHSQSTANDRERGGDGETNGDGGGRDVGEWSGDDFFGYAVGRRVRLVDIRVYPSHSSTQSLNGGDGGMGGIERGIERLEASTTAEIQVTRGMLNGAGMLHGGCVAYLVDNCCSTPLVVLGLMQGRNGVGVTQAMNVLFHSPAAVGTTLRIVSTSISLGGRVMSSRCEMLVYQAARRASICPVAYSFIYHATMSGRGFVEDLPACLSPVPSAHLSGGAARRVERVNAWEFPSRMQGICERR